MHDTNRVCLVITEKVKDWQSLMLAYSIHLQDTQNNDLLSEQNAQIEGWAVDSNTIAVCQALFDSNLKL